MMNLAPGCQHVWLLKQRLSGNRSSSKKSDGAVPEAARWYLAALQPHLEESFVRHHFHQVTWLSSVDSGGKSTDFYVLEFHASTRAALIWAASPIGGVSVIIFPWHIRKRT
jgi:hypothetical protein